MTCRSGSKTGVDGALRSGVTIDHAAIPFAASLQMLAQGETGGLDILPLDGLIDAAVLHLDLLQVAGLEMGPVDLVHLLFHLLVVFVARERGGSAEVRVEEPRPREVVAECRVDLVGDDFVEPLGGRSERRTARLPVGA